MAAAWRVTGGKQVPRRGGARGAVGQGVPRSQALSLAERATSQARWIRGTRTRLSTAFAVLLGRRAFGSALSETPKPLLPRVPPVPRNTAGSRASGGPPRLMARVHR